MKRKKQNDEHYILITDRHVYTGDSSAQIAKVTNLPIEESEFKRLDNYFISKVSDVDIDFLQDKKRLSNIPWQSMLKKDMTERYILYAVIVLEIFNLIRG